MLYSTNTEFIVDGMDTFEGLSLIIDAGFPAIDFSLFKGYDYIMEDGYKERALEIRKFVNDRGVQINQIHAPFGGGPQHYGEITVPKLPRILEFASILGARCAVVHPIHGEQFPKNRDMVFERNIKFYSSLAPYAKDFGIKVALENMWQRRPVSNYINDDIFADPRELALAYDTLADSEAFTVCLDIGHVAICGRDPQDAIDILGSRIGALHVHDVDYVHDSHTLPGQGKLDWDEICRALARVDYKGDFTLEANSFLARTPKSIYPTALKMMNEVAKYYADKIDEYKVELAK